MKKSIAKDNINNFFADLTGMLRIKSLSVFQFMFLLLLFAALISIGLTTTAWIYKETTSINQRISELKEASLNHQKDNLKEEVLRVINYIDFIKNDSADSSIEEIQEKVLNYLKGIRFGNDGYIFVNTYDGIALLFDGQKTDGSRNISDLTDPEGLKIFQTELELAKLPDGGYFQYLFKKMNDTIPMPKISYIRGYDKWQWIIGTGDYFDNIDSEISNIEEEYHGYLRSTFKIVIVVSLSILVLLVLLGSIVAKTVQNQFNNFINLVKHNPLDKSSDLYLDRFYIRELRTIGLDIYNAREVLKKSKEKLESIFRAAPTGIGVVSERVFTEVNHQFCEMVDYTEEELLGKESGILYTFEEEFERVGRENYNMIKEKGTGTVETQFRRKDGQVIDVLLSSTPLDLSDSTKGVTFTALDITERKRAEQDLINALDRATESDRLKSSFLATMSHELRTPLNAVIGFSDLLGGTMELKDINNYAGIINSSGKHLLSLVEDVLNISLIESGESKLKMAGCLILDILAEVHDIISCEQQFQNKGHLALNMVVPPENESLVINTDSAKLKQILINLLKNALKFTPSGYIQYGYTIEPVKGTRMLKFFVKDTGVGVPEDKRKLIFELFRQADESFSRTFGGAGIGLTISNKLAALLGGEIWLESEEGKGSVFYFTLPCLEHNKLSEKEKSQKMRKALNNKTVLIVEDDESSFEYLRLVLNRSGIKTLWAKNGEAAIQYCNETPGIDLVLMDIHMPKLNGYDATREIKRINPDLPVIAQTAYAMVGDREKSIDAGCDDYISKPIKQEVLLDILDKFLS